MCATFSMRKDSIPLSTPKRKVSFPIDTGTPVLEGNSDQKSKQGNRTRLMVDEIEDGYDRGGSWTSAGKKLDVKGTTAIVDGNERSYHEI